jgi:TetR/AcrR family transcriptional regulator, transcriptional repressor for nem operon
MARYSTEHKGQTRARILAASDRLLKERGAEAASIDAVMKGAGLTVGGFYGHFDSKGDLERETLLFGLEASMDRLLAPLAGIADDRTWTRVLIHRYLRQADEPDLASACPMTLLLPEVARGGPAFQAAFSERTGAFLHRVAHRFPEAAGMSRREVAIAVFASCAGAVAFARTIPAPHARERVLHATETMLVAAFGLDDRGTTEADFIARTED